MPSKSEHSNCWIVVENVRYGPGTCELEEDAGSPPQQKHSWRGLFTFNEVSEYSALDFPMREEGTLILEDGRQGIILMKDTRTVIGVRSGMCVEFLGRGDLEDRLVSEARIRTDS